MADRDIEQAADAAGRGDATRPDPTVIEATALAIATGRCPEISPCDLCIARATPDAVNAADVIVPATAEQIAAAIEAERDRQPAYHFRYGLTEAAEIARRFAAGLSAGAATTEGDR